MGVQPLLKSMPANAGVLVSSVLPGGPAEKAGIRPGDVITSFNGTAIPAARATEDLPAFNRLVFGVSVRTDVAVERKRPNTDGMIVVGVRNGGGASESKPTVRAGDIITRFGREPITRTAASSPPAARPTRTCSRA